MAGLVVKIDGINGSGKSTLVRGLASRMADAGLAAAITREFNRSSWPQTASVEYPDGQLAALPLALDDCAGMDDLERQMIMTAISRRQNRRVLPNLRSEAEVVLSDRSSLSCYAYSCDIADVWHPWVDAVLAPYVVEDLVLLLRLDVPSALRRYRASDQAAGPDSVVLRGSSFLGRVQTAYESAADRFIDRVVRLDASGSPDQLVETAMGIISRQLMGS